MSVTPGDHPLSVDPDLTALFDQILSSASDKVSEGLSVGSLDLTLWAQLGELGLTRLTWPEARGGSGAGWPEAAALLTAAARHGVTLPIVEHDLLAGVLADAVPNPPIGGLGTVPNPPIGGLGTVTVGVLDSPDTPVPFAGTADRLLLVAGGPGHWQLHDLARDEVIVTPVAHLAGEDRGTVATEGGPDGLQTGGTPIPDPVVAQLRLRGALARAVQICGALDRAVDLAVQHTRERVQFGRPIAAFQAVQALVAEAAAEAALARAATEAALVEAVTSEFAASGLLVSVASARSVCGHAGSVVVRNTHQALGAIGTTREHALHRATMPALAWANEYGSVAEWDQLLARQALADGGANLWALVTGTP